ncbi:MAG TPA: YkgJ family cysteine cluster protein [Candidatus Nanoarchaeia archaeon]|nr:YkgJ family cysteine cluster protein [Candidatus Nanoarchaeia archaeon]
MQIAKKEDCQRCKGCCIFDRKETRFAPVFTLKEIAGLDAEFILVSNNLYKPKLVFSEGNWQCPFLDANHLCSIQHRKPLCCNIWPFIFMKNVFGQLVIACFEKKICPSLRKMSEGEFKGRVLEFYNYIKKEKIIEYVKDNPGLVWKTEPFAFVIKKI